MFNRVQSPGRAVRRFLDSSNRGSNFDSTLLRSSQRNSPFSERRELGIHRGTLNASRPERNTPERRAELGTSPAARRADAERACLFQPQHRRGSRVRVNCGLHERLVDLLERARRESLKCGCKSSIE